MKAFLFGLLWISPCAALASQPGIIPPFFHCELINVAAPDQDKSRLLILVGVPIDALSFVKTAQDYEARFSISIAVFDQDGFGVAEREAQERVHVANFAESNAPQKYHFSRYEIDLRPGKYEATVTVTDAASSRRASLSADKVLQNFSPMDPALAVSDLLITNRLETDSTGKSVITPEFFQNRAAPGQQLYCYLEVKSKSEQAPWSVRQIMRNRQNKTILDQKRPWPRHGALERIVVPIWTDHLPYGAYELEMQVQHGKAKRSARQKFHLIWNGIPETGMHVQQALAQAALIATDAERKALEKMAAGSSIGAQRAALQDFWAARDDTPATPENEAMAAFYQRVEVADEKFGRSREGWKTDPGKILIQLGVPDAIEVDAEQPRMQRRQIWRYHRLHRHFLFVDPYGFGDFVLAQEQAR